MTTKTLEQYAEEVFPHHRIRGGSEFGLADEAIVAHFHDLTDALDARREVMMAYAGVGLDLVEVDVGERTVRATPDEDRDGIIDLPTRRLGAGAAVVGVISGVAVLVVLLVVSSVWAAVICAGFAAALGAWVGFLVSGGARHAGDHAWEQHADVGGRTMALLGAHPRSHQEAVEITSVFDDHRPETVRIVGEAGWHAPSSFAAEPTVDPTVDPDAPEPEGS